MKLNRTKNTQRNMAFGLGNKAVAIVLPFLIRTVIIRTLGAEYLGLNSLFSSILQVLNMSELGFSSAVVYSMYKPIAENDDDAICALLNFYRTVYRIIGTGILIVGLILLPFLTNFIKDGAVPEGINIYILYCFYLANTVISYFLFAYKTSVLYAFQRSDVTSRTLMLTQGLMYLVQIVLLLVTRNYYLYIVMMPIFTVINNLINAYRIKKLFPQYVCRGKIGARELASVKKQVPGLMINKICHTSRNALDNIFISAFLGLTVAGMYGNYYYVMNALFSVLIIFNNSVVAGVGNSEVTETREKNYEMMKRLNFIYMWIVGWCAICLLLLYQPFVALSFGREMLFPMGIVVLFCMYFYTFEMGVVRGIYAEAAGLWWETRWYSVAEALTNLTLNYLLGKYFGVAGIISATMISLFFINFLLSSRVVFRCYFKNGKIGEYYLLQAKYALVTCAIAAISYAVIGKLPSEGVLALVLRGAACVVLPNCIYLAVYYRSAEYADASEWLLRAFRLEKRFAFLIPKNRKGE